MSINAPNSVCKPYGFETCKNCKWLIGEPTWNNATAARCTYTNAGRFKMRTLEFFSRYHLGALNPLRPAWCKGWYEAVEESEETEGGDNDERDTAEGDGED